MRRQRIIHTKNATDSDKVNADYLLIFYHNIKKGDVFTSEKDFLFANKETKYSIFGYIDDSYKFDQKNFEFLIEYPDDNTHGFWYQNTNPWFAEHDSDVGYISKGNNFKGSVKLTGLTKFPYPETYVEGCTTSKTQWYYSIGSTRGWGESKSIPGSYNSGTPPLYEVFLWMRIPSLSFLKTKSFGLLTCTPKKSFSLTQFFCILLLSS